MGMIEINIDIHFIISQYNVLVQLKFTEILCRFFTMTAQDTFS